MSTTWEQLEGAALSLARAAPIKERLVDAFRNHLSQVDADELPQALRAQFRACHQALTRERPLRGEDAVRATVRKMSNLEADELACSVVRLFADMVREVVLQAAPALPVTIMNGATAAVPATAAKVLKAVPQVVSLYAAAEA
jgi:hypothetical protein